VKPLPTDLEILEAIYDRYYDEFQAFTGPTPDRQSKNYIAIDIPALASTLRVDADIIFGRLYYHLQEKHGFERVQDDVMTGTHRVQVPFFTQDLGGNAVNFPLLSSVLAALREEHRKFQSDRTLSIIAIVLSVVAIITAAIFR
jgi:hypothetical protein